jgi:hypothetical protein
MDLINADKLDNGIGLYEPMSYAVGEVKPILKYKFKKNFTATGKSIPIGSQPTLILKRNFLKGEVVEGREGFSLGIGGINKPNTTIKVVGAVMNNGRIFTGNAQFIIPFGELEVFSSYGDQQIPAGFSLIPTYAGGQPTATITPIRAIPVSVGKPNVPSPVNPSKKPLDVDDTKNEESTGQTRGVEKPESEPKKKFLGMPMGIGIAVTVVAVGVIGFIVYRKLKK